MLKKERRYQWYLYAEYYDGGGGGGELATGGIKSKIKVKGKII